jgi:hypothetical protein
MKRYQLVNDFIPKLLLAIKSFWFALIWTIWNSVFGLIMLFAIYVIRAMLRKESDINKWLTNEYINSKIVDEGIIMFLCCALMGEVSIDYLLSNSNLGKRVTAGMVGWLFLSVAFASLVFSQLFFHPSSGWNFDILVCMQNYFAIAAGFYCLLFKTILFYLQN